MWKFRNRGVVLAMIMVSAGTQAHAAESVESLLQAASRDGAYVAPGATEVEQAEALFLRCFDQCDAADVRQGWQHLGFEVLRAEHGGHPVIIVRERAQRREGRGFYLFNLKTEATTALQAPHSDTDKNTREITLRLLAEGNFRAAAWNTVPRHYKKQGVVIDADMAHLPETYFLAFGRAYARRFGQGMLVQLHGFAQGKRRSVSGAGAEMVVSAGSKATTPTVLRVGRCLKQAGLGEIRIYPAEIRELGATTNSTGHALRAMGHAGFVHIEMSAETRLALLSGKAERARLLRCMGR